MTEDIIVKHDNDQEMNKIEASKVNNPETFSNNPDSQDLDRDHEKFKPETLTMMKPQKYLKIVTRQKKMENRLRTMARNLMNLQNIH